MKKAIIVDVTGLHQGDMLIAHMPKVAENYFKVLNLHFDAKIAGGPIYTRQFGKDKVAELPYDCENIKRNVIGRLKVKWHEIVNTIVALRTGADIVVFQSYSRQTPILIGILLAAKCKQQIFLIQYFKNKRIGFLSKEIEKVLFHLCKDRVAGIICTFEEVGKSYHLPYIVVPDYFYFDENIEYKNIEKIYDYGVFGQIGKGKQVEDVINAFKGKKEKVIIAGRFSNQERYCECQRKSSDNITIINRYLSEEEYSEFFNKCKFIILPYAKGYNDHSSGVVLDAIFAHIPVLCTRVNAFSFVEKYQIGILYDDLKNDILEMSRDYSQYLYNIERYLKLNHEQAYHLCEFLDEHKQRRN